MEYKLYFDGGSRGNPGPAGSGWVLYRGVAEVACGYHFLGTQTNNFAEYTGLIEGLSYCVEDGCAELLVYGDSQLVIKQMRGEYKVRTATIVPLYEKARSLAAKIPKITYTHVMRENNKRADELSNVAMNLRETGVHGRHVEC